MILGQKLTAEPVFLYSEKMSRPRFLFAQAAILALIGDPAVARYTSRATDEALAANPTALFINNLFGIVIAIVGIFSLARLYGQKKEGTEKAGLSFVQTSCRTEKRPDQLSLCWCPSAGSKAVSCLALVILFPLVGMIPLGFLVMDGRDLLMSWLLILTGLIALWPCWRAFSVVFVPKVCHKVTFDLVSKSVSYTKRRGFFTTFKEVSGPDVVFRVQSYDGPSMETSPSRYGVVLTLENGREMVLDCFARESEARNWMREVEKFTARMRSS